MLPKYLVLKISDVSADRKSATHIVYTTDEKMWKNHKHRGKIGGYACVCIA